MNNFFAGFIICLLVFPLSAYFGDEFMTINYFLIGGCCMMLAMISGVMLIISFLEVIYCD